MPKEAGIFKAEIPESILNATGIGLKPIPVTPERIVSALKEPQINYNSTELR